MLGQEPVVLRRREINDGELRLMIRSAIDSGDTSDFFGRFEYFLPGAPAFILVRGMALLTKCKSLAPDAYEKLHKGTPFYWLAWAAFTVHDFETAAFYIDAAISEDLKHDPANQSSPALLFFLVDDTDPKQASLELVKTLRAKIEISIGTYNKTPGANTAALSFSDIQNHFLRPAILEGNERLRTLVTTFISFMLEWDHRSDLMEIRVGQGTTEPFFIHLLKGCLLFESLLKSNPKTPSTKTKLEALLSELHSPLGIPSQMKIGARDFSCIQKHLLSDNESIATAIQRTGQMRNTTSHNLGWRVSLSGSEYNSLAKYISSSCLHAVACLYR